MDFTAPETSSRLITLLASLMVVLQLLLVAERMLLTNIRLFALQSLVLSLIALVVAIAYGAWHVLVVALLTVIGKVVILPWLLRRLVQRTQIEQGARPYLNVPASMFICGALTLLAYVMARPFTSLERLGSDTLGVALMLLFTGFFLMITRRTAITQVLGLLTTENGVMLAAIALTTYGMPLVVELAIFIDVVAAVVVLGLLVLRIRESYNSTDVSKLSELKG